MVLIDSVSRYIEGVISSESVEEESFSNGLLEYPQYTRPETFLDRQVPEILKSRKSSRDCKMEKIKIYRNNKTNTSRFIKLGKTKI